MSSELLQSKDDSPRSKIDIVNALGEINGWDKYLEVCTPSTGLYYSRVNRSRFRTCHRLMYSCPVSYDDGMSIDFRHETFDIAEAARGLQKSLRRYHVILVDPFHEYRESLRDITLAFELLEEGGILVVHDCLPCDETLVAPRYHPGDWCGVTYRAFLDFVLQNPSKLEYYTVNIDFGCGIVRRLTRRSAKPKAKVLPNLFGRLAESFHRGTDKRNCELLRRWQAAKRNDAGVFPFFQKNAAELLRLKSFEEFLAIESVQTSTRHL